MAHSSNFSWKFKIITKKYSVILLRQNMNSIGDPPVSYTILGGDDVE